MSLEPRVSKLESQHESLNHALCELMKVVGATHEVVTLILKEQLELRKEAYIFKGEIKTEFKSIVKGFEQQNQYFEKQYFEKIEETLI